MKPESESLKHRELEFSDGYSTIKMGLISPDIKWIKGKIAETHNPFLSMYLPGHQIVHELKICNDNTGKSLNLVDFLEGVVEIVRFNEDELDLYDCFLVETGFEENDENRLWMSHFVNQFTSLPKIKAIEIGEIRKISSLVAVLHEAKHIELGHTINHKNTTPEGAMQIMFDENEASVVALEDFEQILLILGMEKDSLYATKRMLDAFFYTYAISFAPVLGMEISTGIRDLDLTDEDKAMIEVMMEWLIVRFK